LAQSAHKLAEAMYAQAQQASPGSDGGTEAGGKEKVVDAEFEEVDKEKK
jgi:molecular chaperone DnaK